MPVHLQLNVLQAHLFQKHAQLERIILVMVLLIVTNALLGLVVRVIQHILVRVHYDIIVQQARVLANFALMVHTASPSTCLHQQIVLHVHQVISVLTVP
jgi:hypothetical protein